MKDLLITGGTGSLGNELTRLWLRETTEGRVVIYSRDEEKQRKMARELKSEFSASQFARMRFHLGDVRDENRLRLSMNRVNWVVHAAALKQIPATEYNPEEAVLTNVIGTRNVLAAARSQGVERVAVLSSDKAVSPINLYGATKLCAEKLAIQSNVYSERTRVAVVRYGNVLGSRGSVLQIWQNADTIEITDLDSTRFYFSLNKAAQLVWLVLCNMVGGETFVPLLQSARLGDLAELFDKPILQTGMRPGEKRHESLFTEEESLRLVRTGFRAWYFCDVVALLPEVWEWKHPNAYPESAFGLEGDAYSSANHLMAESELRELIAPFLGGK